MQPLARNDVTPSVDPGHLPAEEPAADDVRAQLVRISAARAFRASDRQRGLLEHLVEARLAGRERELTQRHLADAVFARGPAFDPEKDAVVRVEMRKLRQALTAYYAEDGAADQVIISIPIGSYVPRFSAGASKTANAVSPVTPLRVAVAGFRDLSDQARDGWMAEGIRAELTTILGRIPELQLLPPYEPVSVDDQRQRMRWLRERHQIRFVLDGSTRLIGKGVRVHVFLYDLAEDRQVWSGRYDRVVDPDSLLAIGEDIARRVVAEAADLFTGVIGRSLRREAEGGAIVRDPVYKAQILFHRYLHQTSDSAYRDARDAVDYALGRHPDDPVLLSMSADLCRAGYALGFSDHDGLADHVVAMNERALLLAPNCVPCRVSLCFSLLFRRDMSRLHDEIETILADSTAPSSYHADAAVPLALSGQWDRGCRLLEQSVGGIAVHPHYFQYPFFLREFHNRDYTHAAELGRRLADTGFFWRPMFNAAVSGKVGDREAGDRYLDELRRLRPDTAAIVRRSLASYLAEDELIEDVLDGLRRAGLAV